MLTGADKPGISQYLEGVAAQFQGLNPKEPGQWPPAPKFAACIVAGVVALIFGWFLLLASQYELLSAEATKEPILKNEFVAKLSQAASLSDLRKQKSQVEEYVQQLEKQLPGKAEMDSLLSDINQAGLGRGLQIDLFKPGPVVVKDYYAEQPIELKVTGRYHDLGAFASDMANLSRIVTLHDIQVSQVATKDGSGRAVGNPGVLTMAAVARTYRYLDASEVEEQKRLVRESLAGKKK
ncbi:type 4a pilus biogenesis protein PilO [Roseateles sp. BYS180W]|uniref:Type 4a pilus biogenesis protein PilO n=1 Tax=Roseateles rivi TaxID=3299028 RepID=A0ABW7FRC5_9BURK